MTTPSPLHQIENDIISAINGAHKASDLEKIRIEYFGKKSVLSTIAKQIGTLPLEERKQAGADLNTIKKKCEDYFQEKLSIIEEQETLKRLKKETLDVTLPVRSHKAGKIHPLSQVIDEVIAIFGDMGFIAEEGPEIEQDWYNFSALNIPPAHPAREMQDTFYVDAFDDHGQLKLLRTHTSPVQIRSIIKQGAPLRIIAPGRTYRSDSDITHTPMFHQVEGLVIEKNIHFGHLKGCLQDFMEAFFHIQNIPLRFRPSHFPFTEPSAEVDIACTRHHNELKIGAGDTWLEILGSGMVHPNVIANAGLNPDEWQGFAFGVGIERITMLKYGITDLRTFFDPNIEWLEHYGFKPWHQPSLIHQLVGS